MASKLKVDELEGVTTAGSIDVTSGSTTTNLQEGLSTTTLNLNQETQAIVRSSNISSTADGGSGDSTINYTTSYSDATYVFNILGVYHDGSLAVQESYGNGVMGNSFSKSSSSMRFRFMHVTSNVYDLEFTNVLIHGDLS